MESEYWRIYFGQQIVERSNKIREEHTIQSTGVNIHIDVYPHPNPNAPIVIFNHGTAGYCRLFVPLALSFYDRGYTVVLPDQKGQGFSSGKRGDYTISECVQNIVDVAHWSKNRFNSALFIAGGSVGGALSYYAVSAGAPAHAVSCLDLLDFGNGVDGLKISRLAFLARYALVVAVIKAGAVALKPIHWLRIPAKWVGAFEKLMDERDTAFQQQWDADPVPSRLLSLRSLASNMTSSPAIPFEQNKTPVLVINQSLDKMIDPTITRKNFERLTGPKQYLEVPFGHWSGQPQFLNTIVKASDEWFQKHLP